MKNICTLFAIVGSLALALGQEYEGPVEGLKDPVMTEMLEYMSRRHQPFEPIEPKSRKNRRYDDGRAKASSRSKKPQRDSSTDRVAAMHHELAEVQKMALQAIPMIENLRENVINSQGLGIGQRLDVILRTLRESILSILQILRMSMPDAAPVIDYIAVLLARIFG